MSKNPDKRLSRRYVDPNEDQYFRETKFRQAPHVGHDANEQNVSDGHDGIHLAEVSSTLHYVVPSNVLILKDDWDDSGTWFALCTDPIADDEKAAIGTGVNPAAAIEDLRKVQTRSRLLGHNQMAKQAVIPNRRMTMKTVRGLHN